MNRESVRLVLTDIPAPERGGPSAIRKLRQAYASATLIVVSSSDKRRDVAAAFRSGACAFVSKAVAEDILVAVMRRRLADGRSAHEWITPEGGLAISNSNTLEPRLTIRQKEVLGLLCRGYSNKEIALQIGLAEITVKQHLSGLFRALNADNRTQAVLSARQRGLAGPIMQLHRSPVAR